jgi:hypothetical protein
MQPASVSPEAMREHLVQQGFDPAVAAEAVQMWQRHLGLAEAHDPFSFRRDLGLPDDPKAMTVDQLDQLIAYHDSLCERFDQALTRLDDLSEQMEAAMREHGVELVGETEVVGDLRGTNAAPLLEAWTEAFGECNWCGREVEAVAAYAEPLLEDERG